jgi:hypothetical protein
MAEAYEVLKLDSPVLGCQPSVEVVDIIRAAELGISEDAGR